ncbi:MAG: hypothetical protein PT977_13180 [Acidobacteriota bacterium]|nr:hypothetical protein [Acidobacteriota bacterium]
MRTFRSAFLVAALATICSAGVARAQAIPFDIEVGYRFLTITGSEESYRSQVNEREGFLVRSLHVGQDGKSEGFPILDRLRIDGADLGAGPAGSLMLDAGLSGAYRLRASYRHYDVYSALTGFANPLGASVGQQTWDRTRNNIDVNLELLPGAVVTPLFGYTSNDMQGPGYSTTSLGGDEFQLAQDLRVHDQEIRVGAGFRAGPVSGEFLQGWRIFHETESLSFIGGKGDGNNPGPVLDKKLNLSSFTSSSVTDINAPTTSVFVRGFATDFVQLTGFYVKTISTGDDTASESSTGSLASFPIARFFTGLTETTSSRIDSTLWRAGARLEARLFEGVNVTGGFVRRHGTLAGQDLVTSLFTGTTTFTGFSLADIQTLLSANTSIERTEDVYDVQVAAKAFGPFGIRAGYSQIQQNVTVTPDPSEIVVPGGQGGNFDRKINRYEGALTFAQGGFFLAAEAAWDDANVAVLRTDYLTRKRERVRATWKGFGFVTLGATGLWIDQKNDTIGFTGSVTQYTGDVTITPVKMLRLHGAYGRMKADSTIPVRAPQDFTTFSSLNTEDGELLEAGLGLNFGKLAIDGFWTRFENVGTYAYRLYRGGARAGFDFSPRIGVIGEWAVDRYLDYQISSSSYRAERIGAYLKWRP